jgi:DNA-binding CsgD family transcriptional regulator
MSELTEREIAIIQMRLSGMKLREIAAETGLSVTQVWRILRRPDVREELEALRRARFAELESQVASTLEGAVRRLAAALEAGEIPPRLLPSAVRRLAEAQARLAELASLEERIARIEAALKERSGGGS